MFELSPTVNGAIGLVVPNRMFRNKNADVIRRLITDSLDILTIVDFGSIEVFQGTSAYIGCIIARHQSLLPHPSTKVKVIDVKALPQHFVAALLLDVEGGSFQNQEIHVYEAQHPRGPNPWVLLSAAEKRAQINLSDASVPLSTVAGIFQGIRTGANDIFILKIEAEDDQYGVQVTNGLGDGAVLERGLLRPVVFGSEVRKYEVVTPNKYLLYPYIKGVLVSEAEMQLRYPQTYRYLISYREILDGRTSIISSGLKWYELVRRRHEEWLSRPKLLIRDLAPETSFAIDPVGSAFIVGGTAIIPERDDLLLPLLGYLNSKSIDALVRRSTPQFRGSFQKFEPQHLQRIPVLSMLLEDDKFADALTLLTQAALAVDVDAERRHERLVGIDRFVERAMRNLGVEVDR